MTGRARSETTRDPRTVPGFDRAVELGLVPRVPSSPPDPGVANSRHLLRVSVTVAAVGILGVLAVAGGVGPPGWVMGLLSLGAVGSVVGVLRLVRQVQWHEMQAGYCRLDYMVASFSRDPENRFPASRMKGAPWDLRGLWRLDDAGAVKRAPVAGILPPGHYPSPNRPGELELWTGEVWAYLYRQPRTSFVPADDRPTP